MKDFSKELRLENYLNFHTRIEKVESIIDLDWIRLSKSDLVPVNALGLNAIPLTQETIEKYIDWSFEFGFNKSVVEKEYWIETHYLLENIIEGSSDFEIIISENKLHLELTEITYYIDKNQLEFGLDDTLHNLQNLFFISTSQELPIK